MHIGLSLTFQNQDGAFEDRAIWDNEVHISQLAIELGFDGIWATEHHFTDYEITPEPLQFLTYIAGLNPTIKLGTMVVVLPWHDPVRVAEQVAVLDTLSGGRLILGIGRGLAKHEFDGLRIPVEESRERFVESAELVLRALDTGVLSYDGKHFQQPERDLRPRPTKPFRSRTYAASMSPESYEIMGKLGVGLLVVSSWKSWDVVSEEMANYRKAYAEYNNGDEPPAPITAGFIFCDDDHGRAEELATEYMGKYHEMAVEKYGFKKAAFEGLKGYENYVKISQNLTDLGEDSSSAFRDKNVWGTPEECLEKIEMIRRATGCDTYLPAFSYGGMPMDVVEHSMTLFAGKVMPELQALPPHIGAN